MRKLVIELELENAVYRTPGDTIDFLYANGNRCGSCYILERDDP